MEALLVLHIIITVFLIGVVLIQKSSNDGFTGGGGGNSLMTSKATGNFLTRITAILATLFMANSLLLAYFASTTTREQSVLENVLQNEKAAQEESTKPQEPAKPSVPIAE